MKIVLFLIFCHFFINQVICRESDAAENGLVQPPNQRKRINLTDINEDCQWLIIQQLDLKNLLSLVVAEDSIAQAAGIIFKKEIVGKTVVIGDPQYNKKSTTKVMSDRMTHSYRASAYEITMRNLNNAFEMSNLFTLKEIASFLKYYGHFITKLTVVHDLKVPYDLSRKLFGAINLYCSDTLTELSIVSESNVFYNFKKPFKICEHVSLNGWFDQFKNENTTFASVFPAMTHLVLANLYIAKPDILNEHFPLLTSITVHCVWSYKTSEFSLYSLNETIKLNPQVNKFILILSDAYHLKALSEVAPNLENLELYRYQSGKEYDLYFPTTTITFEHLKTIIMRDVSFSKTSLRFPSLEEAIIDEELIRSSNGFKMINDVTTLKWLNIPDKRDFRQTASFTNGLKLSEIRYNSNDGGNDVLQVEDEESQEFRDLLMDIIPRIRNGTCRCSYVYTKE